MVCHIGQRMLESLKINSYIFDPSVSRLDKNVNEETIFMQMAQNKNCSKLQWHASLIAQIMMCPIYKLLLQS